VPVLINSNLPVNPDPDSDTLIVNSNKLKINSMSKVQAYFRDSYTELMEKVTWPTWQQLQQSTMIVLVATLVITALVWVMDLASNNVLKFVYSLFK
jgi:preprotein translocase subunit SecE